MLSGYPGQRAPDVSWSSGWKESGNKLMFFVEALIYGRSYDGVVKLGIRARKSPAEIMQYQQMIEAITESSRSCRGESCGAKRGPSRKHRPPRSSKATQSYELKTPHRRR